MSWNFNTEALKDHVVIVAGGSGGLGSAATALLSRDGCRVVVGFRRNRARAEELQRRIRETFGTEIRIVEGDISTVSGRERLVSEAASWGSVYGLACFTGDPARVALQDVTDDSLTDSMKDNYFGPLLLARDVAEQMTAKGVSGAIVFISSMQAVVPFPNSVSYAGPKAVLNHAARILARQWSGPGGIRVNVVAPGVNRAGMALKSVESGKYQRFIDEDIIPRFGLPEDVARVVRLLLEPDNYITGQIITVDGGLTLQA